MDGKEKKLSNKVYVQEWTLNLNLSDKKDKKEFTRLFGNKFNVSGFRTWFFSRLVTRLKHGSSHRG